MDRAWSGGRCRLLERCVGCPRSEAPDQMLYFYEYSEWAEIRPGVSHAAPVAYVVAVLVSSGGSACGAEGEVARGYRGSPRAPTDQRSYGISVLYGQLRG